MLNGTNGTNEGVHSDAAIIDQNGPTLDAGQSLLWDALPPSATAKLSAPLDPTLISQRKGRAGRSYDYLEGHVAIAQANVVFGYGGWGYELLDGPTLHEIDSADPRTGEVKRIRAYAATVRITVPGAPARTDVGFHAVTEETAEGHETAYKGAVTDGMKRALRSFGDQFGNGLYGDASTGGGARSERTQALTTRTGSPSKQPTKTDRTQEARMRAMRSGLIELGGMQGFDEGQVRAAVRRQTGMDLEELPAQELEQLVESATRKLQKMQEAQRPPRPPIGVEGRTRYGAA